jgi:hypothetical protein
VDRGRQRVDPACALGAGGGRGLVLVGRIYPVARQKAGSGKKRRSAWRSAFFVRLSLFSGAA